MAAALLLLLSSNVANCACSKKLASSFWTVLDCLFVFHSLLTVSIRKM